MLIIIIVFLTPVLNSQGMKKITLCNAEKYYYCYYFMTQVVKIPGVKNYKSSNQNVGWTEIRQVNWQSVVQKHAVEAL